MTPSTRPRSRPRTPRWTAAAAPVAEQVDVVRRVAASLSLGAPPPVWQPLVGRALELLGPDCSPGWARFVLLMDPVEPVLDGPVHAGRWTAAAGDFVASLWPTHRLRLLGTWSSGAVVSYFTGTAAWAELAAPLQSFVASPPAARARFANAFIALAALAHAMSGAADEAGALIAAVAVALERMDVADHDAAGSLWFATAAAWELRDAGLAARLGPLAERQITADGPPGPRGIDAAHARASAGAHGGDPGSRVRRRQELA